MGRGGFEHPSVTPPKTAIPENLRTESGTPKDETPPQNADVAFLIDRWPGLRQETRTAILNLVRTATECKTHE